MICSIKIRKLLSGFCDPSDPNNCIINLNVSIQEQAGRERFNLDKTRKNANADYLLTEECISSDQQNKLFQPQNFNFCLIVKMKIKWIYEVQIKHTYHVNLSIFFVFMK